MAPYRFPMGSCLGIGGFTLFCLMHDSGTLELPYRVEKPISNNPPDLKI
jgi:hypothetical protein